MRRLSFAGAALCVVAVLASPAWGQTPSPPVPTREPAVPPVPPSPPPVDLPDLREPDAPAPTPSPDASIPAPPRADDEDVRDAAPARTRTEPADAIWWDVGYRYPGRYSTSRLSALLHALEERGFSALRVRRAAAPFIVAGEARFWDSWGEVRHADSGLRPHLGQDVFCEYGAPVLAGDHGTLEYGHDPTGGLVARVHRDGSGYWYYAHLSRFAAARSTGDRVRPGDLIGYCGTSGNAAGTPPHVHFSYFVNHVAQNPMGALIGWLQTAEARAAKLLRRPQPRRASTQPAAAASKEPIATALISGPRPSCYAPLPEDPLELAVLVIEDAA